MSATSQVNNTGTQYAVKKRKRPQAKKEKDPVQDGAKSNPSKRHRDRLNTELDQLSQLIPFSADVLNKLDKLSILRLAVSYLRNKTYHVAETARGHPVNHELVSVGSKPNFAAIAPFKETEGELSLMALHGFMLVVTQDYNIFHVTDTVQDYIGFPQSDIMNQSMLDLIHADDRDIFVRNMLLNPKDKPTDPPEDGDPPTAPEYAKYGVTPEMFEELSNKGMFHRSFICRLRCLLDNSSGFLALHFTGHLRLVHGQNRKGEGNVRLPPEMGLFLLASPLQSPAILEIRTKNYIFRTKHKLDYTPLGIDAKGRVVLGYTEHQLRQRSGYEFIHSADMMHCADAHTKLMRKGESGLTVFRLLHKDNNWVWVTASARLVYRNGRPDYIISTHRPIPDQEGEDSMKKRSNAFRFDFTGQAVLYGEVNPIGTMGGPEKNPLDESSTEVEAAPTAKKIRLEEDTAPQTSVDRKSLYGAQSMQRFDIYAGTLPNDATQMYARRDNFDKFNEFGDIEPFGLELDDDLVDSGIRFYPIGGGEELDDFVSGAFPQLGQSVLPQSGHMNGHADHENFAVDGYAAVGEPPPLSHLPVASEYAANTRTNDFPSHQQQRLNPIGKGPYEYSTPQEILSFDPQWNTQMRNAQSSVTFAPQPDGQTTPKTETPFSRPEPFPSYVGGDEHPAPHMAGGVFAKVNHDAQEQHMPGSCFAEALVAGGNARANFVNHSNNPVINAMTISSTTFEHTGAVQRVPENMAPAVMPAGANTEFNKVELFGHQENMIQFDLDKIARDYQTTDPLSKVESYMSQNPSHAMAIATGLIPEKGMVRLNPEKVQAYLPSCQYHEPLPEHTPGYITQQPRHPISQKDMYYFDQSDESSCISPDMSVSSFSSTSPNMVTSPNMPATSPLHAPNKKLLRK